MSEFEEITIKNYRAIDDLSFSPKKVNVLVGPNNSGKSSILEAIALLISGKNFCKNSLGNSVLDQIIEKYSMDYILRDQNKPVHITYKNYTLVMATYSTGYPIDETGTIIQNYFSQKIHEYLTQPNSINRYKSQFLKDNRVIYSPPQRTKQLELDLQNKQRIQLRLPDPDEIDLDENTQYIDHTLEDYIDGIYDKIESDLYIRKKIVISGYSDSDLDFLYVDFNIEKKRFITRENIIYDFLRNYNSRGFFTAYLKKTEIINFMSDLDTGSNTIIVEKLYDEIIKKNLMTESIEWIVSKIPYLKGIYKTNEGLFVSLAGHEQTIPLASMGDGLKSMLKIIFLSVLAKNGAVVLEEPEMTMHPGYIEMLAESITLCSKETQFFISTHSKDLIESLLEIASNNECLDDIQILKMHARLDLSASELETISGSEALDDIETIKADLRGV